MSSGVQNFHTVSHQTIFFCCLLILDIENVAEKELLKLVAVFFTFFLRHVAPLVIVFLFFPPFYIMLTFYYFQHLLRALANRWPA